MPRSVREIAKQSKNAPDKVIGKYRQPYRSIAPVIDELRLIFRNNCAAEIAHRSGRSVRVCEIWLSGRGKPDGEALAALFCSDIGDRLHQALIRDVTWPWADNVRAVSEISKLRKQQADAARRLEVLERGIR